MPDNEGDLGAPPPETYEYSIVVETFVHSGLRLPGVHLDVYDWNGNFVVQMDTGLDGTATHFWTSEELFVLAPGSLLPRVDFSKDGYQNTENFCYYVETEVVPGETSRVFKTKQILLPSP